MNLTWDGNRFYQSRRSGTQSSKEAWAQARGNCLQPGWECRLVPAQEGPRRANGEEKESLILERRLPHSPLFIQFVGFSASRSVPGEAQSST